MSGLVLSLSVTPGGAHDSTQLHPLVARARELCGDLCELLADVAYGGVGVGTDTRNRHGVTVVFDSMRATCPGGVATCDWKLAKEGDEATPMFTWPKESAAECACASTCPVHRDRRRHLKLHPRGNASCGR